MDGAASMSRLASLLLALALGALSVPGCGAGAQPQLRVLSVERAPLAASRTVLLFVEVVNPAAQPMQLQRLEYTFASAGAAHPGGEVHLTRVIEPGASVVVEVPLSVEAASLPPGQHLTLAGRLFAEQDQLQRSFPVAAELALPAETAAGFVP